MWNSTFQSRYSAAISMTATCARLPSMSATITGSASGSVSRSIASGRITTSVLPNLWPAIMRYSLGAVVLGVLPEVGVADRLTAARPGRERDLAEPRDVPREGALDRAALHVRAAALAERRVQIDRRAVVDGLGTRFGLVGVRRGLLLAPAPQQTTI